MTINVPRLVHRDGHFNVVAYDGRYYRVPLSLGRVLVDAMTAEQQKAVRVFGSRQDAVDGVDSPFLRGASLIRVNRARETTGKPKLSRIAALSGLRGTSFNSERGAEYFLIDL